MGIGKKIFLMPCMLLAILFTVSISADQECVNAKCKVQNENFKMAESQTTGNMQSCAGTENRNKNSETANPNSEIHNLKSKSDSFQSISRHPQINNAEFIKKAKTLDVPFIANEGQTDECVKFYAKTFGGTVFVTKDGEIIYALPKVVKKSVSKAQFQQNGAVALREEVVNGKFTGITGEGKSVTQVNYFKGNDPSKWKNSIPTYKTASLGAIYAGIDLKLKAYGDNVEKLFTVKPGASPETIRLKLNGAKALKINRDGQLEVRTVLGTVKFTSPVAYQEIDGRRVEVPVRYRIQKSAPSNPKSEYGFKVVSYDRTRELVIDPLLASTFLGGGSYDYGNSIALDTSGNVYITGVAYSSDFPTISGAYDTSYNGGDFDTFVSKLDSSLTSLLASTFLGGSSADAGNSIALDTSGNVYVSGAAESSDFPTTSGAYDTSHDGSYDAFVLKLNSSLTSLFASTLLGGGGGDYGRSIALDTSGNVYVTGHTASSDFPTTSGAPDVSYNGGMYDIFVSKLNSSLTSLFASTLLGGGDTDEGRSIALDTSGNVYITGDTASTAFPTTNGAYDTSHNGSYDAFVSKLNSSLTSLLVSTFLGGVDNDVGHSIALDTNGNVYVTGSVDSLNFPTTSGAYDT